MSAQIRVPFNPDATISESKLYLFARTFPLLQFLIPELPAQIRVEVEIKEVFPREDDDSDDTRILINYTNIKGNSMLYKLNDTERLNRKFDIDHFMNGLVDTLATTESLDLVTTVNNALMMAINMSVLSAMGITEGLAQTKNFSTVVVQTLVAILFDDALDVIILVNEMPPKEGNTDPESMITGMWIVKQRENNIPVTDSNTSDKENA